MASSLIRSGCLLRRRNGALLQPSEEDGEIARFKPVQVAAADAIEAPALFEDGGNVYAICEEDSTGHVVGEAEEGR